MLNNSGTWPQPRVAGGAHDTIVSTQAHAHEPAQCGVCLHACADCVTVAVIRAHTKHRHTVLEALACQKHLGSRFSLWYSRAAMHAEQ